MIENRKSILICIDIYPSCTYDNNACFCLLFVYLLFSFLSFDSGRFTSQARGVTQCYGSAAEDFVRDRRLYNAGAWGGTRSIVSCLLSCITSQLSSSLTSVESYNCNTPAYNWCVHYGDCILEGQISMDKRFFNPWRKGCLDSYVTIHNKCKETEGKVCIIGRNESSLVIQAKQQSTTSCLPIVPHEELGIRSAVP